MSREWTDAGFATMLPRSWFTAADDSTALVFCYRVMLVERRDLVPPLVLSLGRVCAIFFYGSVPYFDPGRPAMQMGPDGPGITASPRRATTPEGAYLLLVTSLRVDGVDGDQSAAEEQLQQHAALVHGVLGKNAAYELVFENVWWLDGKRATATAPVIENPWFFPAPKPRADAHVLEAAVAGMDALEPAAGARVSLSLRWIHQAADASGVDGLLKAWIALETLAMPTASDLGPITAALASAYGQPPSKIGQRFAIGRIYRLRGHVVHGGQMRPVHAALLKLLEGIYFDVLFVHLGLPSLRRAEAALSDTGLAVDEMLRPSGPL